MDLSGSGGSWDIIIGAIPIFLSYFAFNVPFWLTIIYLVFGSEFILFVWLDEVLVFLITHWVSNVTPLVHLFSLFIFLFYIASNQTESDGLKAFFYIMTVLEALIGYFYTERTIESSGDACRHLNPQWDFIPRGAKLYPTILYFFGIKDRKEGGSGINPDEHR